MDIENAPAEQAIPATAAAAPQPAPRRTVTLPVLPLAIVAAIVVAVLFFGGGVALGYSIGGHPGRVGIIQPYGGFNQGGQGTRGGQGSHEGFGRQGGQRPHERPSGAPKNG